ncbi:MAG: hypothetical protein R3F55_15735 [Alphaproteobacteria bacterium]
MTTSRMLAAVALAAAFGAATVAHADNQPQRFGAAQDLQIGPAVPGVVLPQLTCMMGSGDVLADVLIRNNGSQAIAPGTQIVWHTNGGHSGMANTGLPGLAPGAVIHAGAAPYPFTCAASIQ